MSCAYQSQQPLQLCYLPRLRSLLYISDQWGSLRGDKGTLNIKRGDRRACRSDGSNGVSIVGGRSSIRRGGRWAKETEKRFSSGIGCASLQRGVPGREGGSDRGQIKLFGLARSTSGTDKMEFYNWHFIGWHRKEWIVEFYRRIISQKEFTRGNLAAFG